MGCDDGVLAILNSAEIFQSTHPVWDATPFGSGVARDDGISIHASRMGCDLREQLDNLAKDISIHASRMGCDLSNQQTMQLADIFQSTHPVWDATRLFRRWWWFFWYFNPRIPYGMRLVPFIHFASSFIFQSTHPVWDATEAVENVLSTLRISIHASRMGCDKRCATRQPTTCYFNPRIPYGMRLHILVVKSM